MKTTTMLEMQDTATGLGILADGAGVYMNALLLLLLTLLHSERPKLYTILAFLSAIGLKGKIDQVSTSYLKWYY